MSLGYISPHAGVRRAEYGYDDYVTDVDGAFNALDLALIKASEKGASKETLGILAQVLGPEVGSVCGASMKRLVFGSLVDYLGEVQDSGYPITVHVVKRLTKDHLCEALKAYAIKRVNFSGSALVEVFSSPGRTAATKVKAADVAAEIAGTPGYRRWLSRDLEPLIFKATEYRLERKARSQDLRKSLRKVAGN